MARSTYVYVVSECDPGNVGAKDVIGTFTVKYEMVSWVQRQIDAGLKDYTVQIERFRDGTGEGVDVTSQFTWGKP